MTCVHALRQVGEDERCDHDACPKRTTDCTGIYGVAGGDECTLVCAGAGAAAGTETVRCVGDEEWATVGEPLQCAEAEPTGELADAGEPDVEPDGSVGAGAGAAGAADMAVAVTLDLDVATIPEGSTARATFETDFKADVARAPPRRADPERV